MKMNPVVHFEMPAEDKKRMSAFYEKAFGWKTDMLGPEMGEYVVVTTTEMDEKTNRPKNPGTINGGFYQKSDDPAGQHSSIVIAVDNIDESVEKVKAAGGRVQGEAYDIPGVGRYISIIDTEGNRISLLQPVMMDTQPGRENFQMNGPSYFEIQAESVERALRFYGELFDWKFTRAGELAAEYWRIETKGARGGLLKRPAKTPPAEYGTNAFVCSFQVENYDEIAEKITEMGGKVAFPKFAVQGVCWQGYFLDTEGNTFGIFQPDVSAK